MPCQVWRELQPSIHLLYYIIQNMKEGWETVTPALLPHINGGKRQAASEKNSPAWQDQKYENKEDQIWSPKSRKQGTFKHKFIWPKSTWWQVFKTESEDWEKIAVASGGKCALLCFIKTDYVHKNATSWISWPCQFATNNSRNGSDKQKNPNGTLLKKMYCSERGNQNNTRGGWSCQQVNKRAI